MLQKKLKNEVIEKDSDFDLLFENCFLSYSSMNKNFTVDRRKSC